MQYGVAEGLGDVLMLRGPLRRGGGTVRQAARDWRNGTFAEAQNHGKIGELAFKRGDMESAAVAFEDAFAAAGENRSAKRPLPAFSCSCWEAGGSDCCTRCFRVCSSAAASGRLRRLELLRLRLLQPVGIRLLVHAGNATDLHGAI